MTDRPLAGASDHSTEQAVGLVLAVGVYGSVGLMVVGALLAAAQPPPAQVLNGPGTILTGLLQGQGLALVQLGIALLIATPVLRVAASVVSFVRRRDWAFVLITLTVLTLLAGSVLLPGFLGQGH